MESWEGYNYYTQNNVKWTELMNLSTTEWNVGWFPANVIAIPGALNDGWGYPPDAFVIENAAEVDLGDRSVEGVVFGISAAIGLLWALCWLVMSIKDKSLNKPRSETQNSRNVQNSAASQHTSITHINGLLRAEVFEQQLKEYYPKTSTETELYERNVRKEPELIAADVEAVSTLLRRIIEKDVQLLALQIGSSTSDTDMNKLRAESDSMLVEVHRMVATWHGRGLNNEEGEEWKRIRSMLAQMRKPRYMHPQHTQETV